MKRAILVLGLAWAGVSAAARPHGGGGRPDAWTRAPLLVPAEATREGVALRALNLQSEAVTVFAPAGGDRARWAVPLSEGAAQVVPAAPDRGNYHWVQAREMRDGMVHVASTVVYFANPGAAPTRMLREAKSELEIVPQPLPREHSRYRESEKWRFLLRWQGAPLADQALLLETANGSRSTLRTDAEGYATVLFPRDFAAAGGGGHGRPAAAFVLSTERREGETHYLTAFNYSYAPEPARTRSLAWGTGFAGLGMLLALPLLRRRENRNV